MKKFLKKYKYIVLIVVWLIFILLAYYNLREIINIKNNITYSIGREFVGYKNGSVYYNEKIVEGADSLTFRKIHKYYAVDKSNVYVRDYNKLDSYFMQKIKEADAKTFKPLKYNYSIDKNFVYHEDKIIKNADSNTFESLNYFYSIDKNNVYAVTSIIEGADPKTFQLVEDYYDELNYAKDKNNCYEYGDIVDMLKCEDVEKHKIERELNEK
ncbi:MAG: DKNYY domain-containing protein [Candidatus Moranbacteria bacterium]|nr:DKNYY domain-containing protein [Candidatus Moranbacteria bacterium]